MLHSVPQLVQLSDHYSTVGLGRVALAFTAGIADLCWE
jgi:hypothetical protein